MCKPVMLNSDEGVMSDFGAHTSPNVLIAHSGVAVHSGEPHLMGQQGQDFAWIQLDHLNKSGN